MTAVAIEAALILAALLFAYPVVILLDVLRPARAQDAYQALDLVQTGYTGTGGHGVPYVTGVPARHM